MKPGIYLGARLTDRCWVCGKPAACMLVTAYRGHELPMCEADAMRIEAALGLKIEGPPSQVTVTANRNQKWPSVGGQIRMVCNNNLTEDPFLDERIEQDKSNRKGD